NFLNLPHKQIRRGNGPIVLGSAGRFVKEKGYTLLIESAAALVLEGIDIKVVLVGAGGMEQGYRELAGSLGVAERLEIRHPTDDLPAFFAGLDIFVLSSLSAEGLSRSMLEAMAAGLPVVVTRVAGTSDVVQHDVSGLVVPRHEVTEMVGT